MKKFSVVRVYSKSLERQLYPIPRTLTMTRKFVVVPSDEVDHPAPPDTVLLHRLIRDHAPCPLCAVVIIAILQRHLGNPFWSDLTAIWTCLTVFIIFSFRFSIFSYGYFFSCSNFN